MPVFEVSLVLPSLLLLLRIVEGTDVYISNLNASSVFEVLGVSSTDRFGFSVGPGGDLNYDGLRDIVVGAEFDSQGVGYAAAIFGYYASSPNYNLSTPLSSFSGIYIEGYRPFTSLLSARSTLTYGDIDSDGNSDLVVSVQQEGCVYVVFAAGLRSNVTLGVTNRNASRICGPPNELFGFEVAVGDVNGDFCDDLVVGSPPTPGVSGTGSVYVFFGQKARFPTYINVTAGSQDANGVWNYGSVQAVKISGLTDSPLAQFGCSVSVGDTNCDSIMDILIGDTWAGDGNGALYILYANSAQGFVSATFSQPDGMTLNGAGGLFGSQVSGAGDVNDDGCNDFLAGAPMFNDGAGAAYLVYGNSAASSLLSVSTMSQEDGFTISGAAGDLVGYYLAAAGDVNGDTVNDFLVGAPNSSSNVAYLVFGSATTTRDNIDLSTDDPGLRIHGDGYMLIDGAGPGDVNGDNLDDLLFGTDDGRAIVVYGASQCTWWADKTCTDNDVCTQDTCDRVLGCVFYLMEQENCESLGASLHYVSLWRLPVLLLSSFLLQVLIFPATTMMS